MAAADDKARMSAEELADARIVNMRLWAEFELDRRIFAHRKTLEHATDEVALDAMTIVMLGTRDEGNSLTREQLALLASAAIARLVKA